MTWLFFCTRDLTTRLQMYIKLNVDCVICVVQIWQLGVRGRQNCAGGVWESRRREKKSDSAAGKTAPAHCGGEGRRSAEESADEGRRRAIAQRAGAPAKYGRENLCSAKLIGTARRGGERLLSAGDRRRRAKESAGAARRKRPAQCSVECRRSAKVSTGKARR